MTEYDSEYIEDIDKLNRQTPLKYIDLHFFFFNFCIIIKHKPNDYHERITILHTRRLACIYQENQILMINTRSWIELYKKKLMNPHFFLLSDVISVKVMDKVNV